MVTVFEIFFRKIPSIVYEPVAVFGVIGFIIVLTAFRKLKKEKFYIWLCGSILFMIFWRAAVQIISSRYALILMIPFTIGASYCCFKLEELARKVKKFPERFVKYIPLICIGVLFIACVGRILAKDTHQVCLKTGRDIAKDVYAGKISGEFSVPVAFCVNFSRAGQFEYYAKIPIQLDKKLFQDKAALDEKNVKVLLERFCHGKDSKNDAVYFIVREKTKQAPLTAHLLGLPETSWKLITFEYSNRKKKTIWRVYRYVPEKNTVGKKVPYIKL